MIYIVYNKQPWLPSSISVTPADPGYLRNKYHLTHLQFWSYVEVWEFLAHDSLPAFLANLAVDKSQDAVVHIQRALALEGVPSGFFLGRTEDGFFALLRVLEFELGKKLLRLHWSALLGDYRGLGALISLSSVPASKLYLEGWGCYEVMQSYQPRRG